MIRSASALVRTSRPGGADYVHRAWIYVQVLGGAGLLVAGGFLDAARAQQIPSADAIFQETQRQQKKLEQGLGSPRGGGDGAVLSGPQKTETPAVLPGGLKFRLSVVVFGESQFLSRDELNAVAARFVGKDVEIADLFRIVAEINKLYAEKGIGTALATLPPQKIESGRVDVKLTEGRLGKLEVKGAQTLDQGFVTDRVPVLAGSVIDPRDLSKSVNYFNRTHDAQLRALLQPGSAFGLSDVQLAVIEPATNTLQLYVDNQGVESTGVNQFGGLYRRYGLVGIDDRLTLYATNARKTLNANAAYNFPINVTGTRLGVSYSRGAMAIIDGPSKPLDVEGWSQSYAVNLTHPLHIDEK